jgi:uncharacterized protein (TIGR02594 family)
MEIMNEAVPKKYSWLYKVKELPLMVVHALELWGIKEVPGKASNPVILKWAKTLGLSQYVNDGIAWCGLAIAWLCHLADKPIILNPLYALNWRYFGMEVEKGDERCGDVYVTERFDKKGNLIGGHVGLIIAQDKTHLHVWGGNQTDQTMVARFPKTRKYWCRRPIYNQMPKGAQVFMVSDEGTPEASKVA